MHDLSTTLVAVATAPGRGGIGCVRVSGPAAHAIARVDGQALRDLIVEYYERLDSDSKALIPLRRLYFPSG